MNLKILRNQTKKTQEEVATELKMQKQTYQNYELGKRSPDIETLLKIADYFGCSVDYLLGHQLPGVSPRQQQALSMIKMLNDTQLEVVISWCSVTLGIPYDDAKPVRPF